MSGNIVLGHSNSTSIAVVRRQAVLPDLTRVVPDACGEVWRFLQANSVQGAGRNVAVYLDDVMNIECGVEVPASFIGDDAVILSATPAGRVASMVHVGPYQLLPSAHQAIRAWCSANGHRRAGPNWEIYGHWTDDPSKLRTDVHYLLD